MLPSGLNTQLLSQFVPRIMNHYQLLHSERQKPDLTDLDTHCATATSRDHRKTHLHTNTTLIIKREAP